MVLVLLFAVAAASCADKDPFESADAVEPCETIAKAVVDRVDDFLEPYSLLTPEEFLAGQELDGLEDLQNDLANLLAPSANRQVACGPRALNDTLDKELQAYAGRSLLSDFVVDSIRTGNSRSVRDIVLKPGADIAAAIELLDSGSSMTLSEGTYEVDRTLLIPIDVEVRGAGQDLTVINSSAADASLVVFNQATVRLRDLTIAHVDSSAASVVMIFQSTVELDSVTATGAAVVQDSGGSGILVTGSDITGEAAPLGAPQKAVASIVNSDVSDNELAGIVAAQNSQVTINNSLVSSNGACGICFFENAAGLVSATVISGNEIGVQITEASAPTIEGNEIFDNAVAGVVSNMTAAPTIVRNRIFDNGESGIEVQGEGAPDIIENVVGAHPVGMSFSGATTALVRSNMTDGATIALRVGEDARPTSSGNVLAGSTAVGLLITGNSAGTFSDEHIAPEAGVGIVVAGLATPTIAGLTVEGGEAGVSYMGTAGGQLSGSSFLGQSVGIDVREAAAPTIESNVVNDSGSRGVLYLDQSAGEFKSNTINAAQAVALQIGATAAPRIADNVVNDGPIGIALVDATTAMIVGNRLVGQNIGVDVNDTAQPTLEDNQIQGTLEAAMIFRDESAGTVRSNTIVDVDSVGIQVTDSAAPSLIRNVLGAAAPDDTGNDSEAELPEPEATSTTIDQNGAVSIGLIFGGDSQGSASENQIFNFIVGVQVGESAAPTATGNFVDGGPQGDVGFAFRDDAAGTASDNRTRDHLIGFQFSHHAAPTVEGNHIESADQAAMLLIDDVMPSLIGNRCPAGIAGIAVSDRANPTLESNQCEVQRDQ